MLPTPGMSAVPHAKKKPVLAYELFLKHGGEGGIDSLRSPLLGPSLGLAPAGPTQALFKNAPGVFVGAARSQARSLSNWLRQLSNPGRGFSSPRRVLHAKKKPVHAYELFLKYGGEGGIDSLRSPLRGSPLAGSRSVQLALPVVEPRSGVLIPPGGCHMRKKKPVLAYELFLKYGGEGGIRTPDTLPYTHFPGVLLQPLGHLTILSCCSPWVGNGALL